MNRFLTTLITAAALAAPGTVFAEGAGDGAAAKPETKPEKAEKKGHWAELLEKHDADKNGALSAEEVATIKSDKLKEKVLALDANKDGSIDATEGEGAKGWGKGNKKDKEKEKEPKAGAEEPKAGAEGAAEAKPAE